MEGKNNSSIGRYISILYRYFQMYLDRELKPYNIGSGQFPILKVLHHHDGISQEKIRNYLRTDKGTIAKSIKRLVTEGYIIRKIDQADKRAYKIYLTEKAYKIKPDIQKILKKWTDILSDGFTEEERTAVLKLLSKMTQNAEEFFSSSLKR